MQTQLLCTFTTKNELSHTLQEVRETYHLVYNYIYVLLNKDNVNEMFVTYNVLRDKHRRGMLRNTILVHRKRETNTLYTINALNMLIKSENNGVVDSSFIVEWDKFRNSIILTDDTDIKRIPTEIYEIITFNDR